MTKFFFFFSINLDLGTDKSGRPQEAISLRAVDDTTGEPTTYALGFNNVAHGNAACARGSIFETLEKYNISKDKAKQGLLCVGADGA